MPGLQPAPQPPNLNKQSKQIASELLGFGYEVQSVLGAGSFAQVLKAVTKSTGETVAVKVICKQGLDKEGGMRVTLEFNAMLELKDKPHVLQFMTCQETTSFAYFVLEYCAGGDLLTMVQEMDGVEERKAKVIFRQIVEGVQHAHKAGWIHRDLKLENILKTSDGAIRLADWGLCCNYVPGKTMIESCGSVHYSAPEICSGVAYEGPEVDIWSLGIVLYCLVSGRMPFYGPNNCAIMKKITTLHYDMYPTFSPELSSLIESILQLEPSNRLSLQQILAHPWVSPTGVDPSLLSLRLGARPIMTPSKQNLGLVEEDQTYVIRTPKLRRGDFWAAKVTISASLDNVAASGAPVPPPNPSVTPRTTGISPAVVAATPRGIIPLPQPLPPPSMEKKKKFLATSLTPNQLSVPGNRSRTPACPPLPVAAIPPSPSPSPPSPTTVQVPVPRTRMRAPTLPSNVTASGPQIPPLISGSTSPSPPVVSAEEKKRRRRSISGLFSMTQSQDLSESKAKLALERIQLQSSPLSGFEQGTGSGNGGIEEKRKETREALTSSGPLTLKLKGFLRALTSSGNSSSSSSSSSSSTGNPQNLSHQPSPLKV